jgi:hypothetical protein
MSPETLSERVEAALRRYEEACREARGARRGPAWPVKFAAAVDDWRKVSAWYGADHPAALGCLLALVREAWGHGPERDVNIERIYGRKFALAVRVWDVVLEAWVYDSSVHGGWMAGRPSRKDTIATALDSPTYGEALVAALEAAP